MEPVNDIPVCPPPWEVTHDVVPMLVVIAIFILGGWLGRLWKKKQASKRKKQ